MNPMWQVLKWVLALIIGTAVTVVIAVGSLLFTAIGALIGLISTGSLIILGVAVLINEWWDSKD